MLLGELVFFTAELFFLLGSWCFLLTRKRVEKILQTSTLSSDQCSVIDPINQCVRFRGQIQTRDLLRFFSILNQGVPKKSVSEIFIYYI